MIPFLSLGWRLLFFRGISLAQCPFNLSLTLTQEMISAQKFIFHICKTIEWGKFIIAVTDEMTADIPAAFQQYMSMLKRKRG